MSHHTIELRDAWKYIYTEECGYDVPAHLIPLLAHCCLPLVQIVDDIFRDQGRHMLDDTLSASKLKDELARRNLKHNPSQSTVSINPIPAAKAVMSNPPMEIILEPHNPAWAVEFDRIKKELRQVLRDIPALTIEHVGSTSIPGLLAKPVLDIDIITTIRNVAGASAALTAAGYTACGEQGVPLRYMFRQPSVPSLSRASGGEIRAGMKRNTYIVVEGSISLRNHLDLKRMLLEHQDLRDEYQQVKLDLISSGVKNMDEYCKGKTDVIQKILVRAGWTEQDLEEVRSANS